MRRFGKEEKMLRQLYHWDKKHLRTRTKVNYALTLDQLKSDSMDPETHRKCIVTKEFTFVSDTTRVFQLGIYGETVRMWLNRACKLIDVFHERHDMRGRLDKLFREDALYEHMEEIFYTLMGHFLHSINFFQYDRIANDAYRTQAGSKIEAILERADNLLGLYGSYLSLQGTSVYPDTAEDLIGIRDAVSAMQEAFGTGEG